MGNTNICEQFVSFDTARLLKEAGFDVPCTSQYTENEFAWENLRKTDFNKSDYVFSRPTQALAARWLREAHGIHVFPVYQYLPEKWSYVIQDMAYANSEKGMKLHTDVFDSCEESLEAGLQEAIKLIKK